MIWVCEVNIPERVNVRSGLSRIYGVGKRFGKNSWLYKTLKELRIDPCAKIGTLDDKQINAINTKIKEILTEGELRRARSKDVEEKKRIGSLQGICHSMGKKVRGQRTRSNNRTRPNSPLSSITRKVVPVAGKKKAPKH